MSVSFFLDIQEMYFNIWFFWCSVQLCVWCTQRSQNQWHRFPTMFDFFFQWNLDKWTRRRSATNPRKEMVHLWCWQALWIKKHEARHHGSTTNYGPGSKPCTNIRIEQYGTTNNLWLCSSNSRWSFITLGLKLVFSYNIVYSSFSYMYVIFEMYVQMLHQVKLSLYTKQEFFIDYFVCMLKFSSSFHINYSPTRSK